ncbi:hypothetical protein ACIBVL_02780 [Streptomyces sp. NPDC049687]|uniref:hypothetical protein n=1 Tax=Streptomyces sp. NPDC049687 TaxID=3365596 RepID=UPI0037B8D12C
MLPTLFAVLRRARPAGPGHSAAATGTVIGGARLVRDGVQPTVEQLGQGVFLRSGNDAVHTLALMNGGVAKSVADTGPCP